ncbi:MAG: hypothetical protein OHK0029_22880 [Armatimonadaceae bacterium]
MSKRILHLRARAIAFFCTGLAIFPALPTQAHGLPERGFSTPGNFAPALFTLHDDNQIISEELIDKYERMICFFLDIKLTPAQRAHLRKQLKEAWSGGDPETIQGTQETAKLHDQLWAMPEAERNLVRLKALPNVVKQLQENVRQGKGNDKWLWEIYLKAHPPLAMGNPPLTRQIVDAMIDIQHWHKTQILQQKSAAPTAAFRAKMYKEGAAEWKKMTPEQQTNGAELVGRFAELKNLWAGMSKPERAYFRSRMMGKEKLTAEDRRLLAQFETQMNQMAKSHFINRVTNTINAFQHNERLINGYERWNAALGRYEWVGGFSTEY